MAEREPLRFPSEVSSFEPTAAFGSRCTEAGIALEQDELQRLGRFLGLLLAANEVVNLTRITDLPDAWERHVFDALTLLPVLGEAVPSGERLRCIDVGSGGGVPALPLACVLPEVLFTLVESVGKKADFLRHAVTSLGLGNVDIRSERAEQLAKQRDAHREAYDVSMCRALGRLPVAAELTCPLVRPGGLCLFIKGAQAEEELEEASEILELLRAAPAGVIPTATGRVLVLEKVGRSPRRFPRPGGNRRRSR
ncbi:MAG: 16S rRNA (guanine(527)-N(7))-methyltransferase RsmG [Planctomycetota bacterium]